MKRFVQKYHTKNDRTATGAKSGIPRKDDSNDDWGSGSTIICLWSPVITEESFFTKCPHWKTSLITLKNISFSATISTVASAVGNTDSTSKCPMSFKISNLYKSSILPTPTKTSSKSFLSDFTPNIFIVLTFLKSGGDVNFRTSSDFPNRWEPDAPFSSGRTWRLNGLSVGRLSLAFSIATPNSDRRWRIWQTLPKVCCAKSFWLWGQFRFTSAGTSRSSAVPATSSTTSVAIWCQSYTAFFLSVGWWYKIN